MAGPAGPPAGLRRFHGRRSSSCPSSSSIRRAAASGRRSTSSSTAASARSRSSTPTPAGLKGEIRALSADVVKSFNTLGLPEGDEKKQ
ncbi:MAG: hypothetical protein M0C28_21015 [Candidatus Moduliflexus flocculans]|nr:hypothetical protein [Candidatus Moduliflexus flocculans]